MNRLNPLMTLIVTLSIWAGMAGAQVELTPFSPKEVIGGTFRFPVGELGQSAALGVSGACNARVVIDDLFGEGLGEVTPRRMIVTINRNRNFYREALGEEMLSGIETILKKARIARRGRAGTTAATASTGSGFTPVDVLFAGAEVITHPVQGATTGLSVVTRRMARDVRNAPERSAVMREALLDPELFKFLLEMPDERALPGWMRGWEKIVSRSRARTQLAAASRSDLLNGRNGQQPGGLDQ